MKKRILTLALVLILLLSTFSIPVSAATAKDVYNCLKEVALNSGNYDDVEKAYYSGFQIGSNSAGSFYFFVQFMEKTNYIHCSIVYYANSSDYLSYEVTWKISSNPSPSYNAFIEIYDKNSSADDTTGIVVLPAGYSGENYSSFKTFKGDSDYKSVMLEILSTFLPGVMEYTRVVINEEDYTLADLGMTGYHACDWIHAYDHGVIGKPATCVEDGYNLYTCRVCGDTYREEVPATGIHSWDNGVVYQEPTCTEPGIRRFTCTVCHTATQDESIPAQGHNWDTGAVYQEPSCTEPGIRRFTCTRCEATRDEDIAALGHVWTLSSILTEPDEEHEHGSAIYTCTRCEQTKEARLCAGEIFTDMPADDHWAHKPIDWAYFHNITSGTTKTTFSPDMTITRAQAVTFLWAAAGKPEPENPENPFTDVPDDGWYTKSVLWAVESGVTKGLSADTFGPFETCTRAQIVTFLWAAAGKPAPKTTENPFTDVSDTDWFVKPVLWAVENGVTKGLSADTFGPYASCTRAQVVTFLYKASLIPAPEPPEDSAFVEWRWLSGGELDRNDVGINFSDHLRITIHGNQIPELYTDAPDVVALDFTGIVEVPDGFPEDSFLYDCGVTVIGEGAAHIFCSLNGEVVGELTVDCEAVAFRDAYWITDDGAVADELNLEDGEQAHLSVTMHYSRPLTGYDAFVPANWEQPRIYTDAPERLSLILSDNPPDYVGAYDRGFLWNGTVTGSGSVHVYIELDGQIVKTLTVTVP